MIFYIDKHHMCDSCHNSNRIKQSPHTVDCSTFSPQNKVPWGTQERAGLSGMGNSITVASIKAESEAEAEAALAT